MYETITPDNVMMYAIRHYDNPQCEGEKEFNDDLKRFKYIKRLLKRYKNTGVLKTHLILNHLTVLFNVFDDAATPLLFYNLEEDLWPAIKSFLIFLNRIPEYPKSHIHDIPEDMVCIKELNLV